MKNEKNLKLILSRIYTNLKKHCIKITYLILIIYLGWVLFFLYQCCYLTLIEKKSVDLSLIQSKKETINQNLFNEVIKKTEEKTRYDSDTPLDITSPF